MFYNLGLLQQAMAKVALIAAGDGKNMELALKFKEMAEEMGHSTDVMDLMGLEWPVITNKLMKEGYKPEGAKDLMDRLGEADGWVCIAPEYNGGMPSSLNNTVAWMSIFWNDFREVFNSRKVGLATHSGGGGDHVIMAMRQMFSYLGCNLIGRAVISNKNKEANPEAMERIIREITE